MNYALPQINHDFEVRRSTYEKSVHVFKILEKILKVNIKLHQSEDQINEGEIFLFNHFARFETFIPQYLIYTKTGALSRSVAANEFFLKDDAFSNYLLNAGAVPRNLPDLLPFLAAEILKGRKVIVFPEGCMVKDRQVVDHRGKYSIYSRATNSRRKHHTGPAVLGLALDVFKQAVLTLHNLGHTSRLEEWAEKLQLENTEDLLAAARRSTAIVPANITFYPMRVGDNLLRKGAELLNRGLSRRLSEELMIEGNILLKHTDMDVRLGDAIYPREYLRWLDRKLLNSILPRLDSLETAFNLRTAKGVWAAKPLSRSIRHNVRSIRDEYMHRMYSNVTVNLCHLASRIILLLVVRGRTEIADHEFHKILYLAVRKIQARGSVQLHRSLRNPEAYSGLLDGDCLGLSQFIKTASSSQLVERVDGEYRFLSKLREKHTLDEIRIENLVAVYANEVAPLPQVCQVIADAIEEAPYVGPKQFAKHRFDDEGIAIHWDRLQFSKPRHLAINEQETAISNPDPFLFEPDRPNGIGVILVHGFLASPAQVREFGEQLARGGYTVLGVRLKGHGTSPWDLRERSWEDWFGSLNRGYETMATLSDRVFLVGFSTGGALALRLAADQPEQLAGVAAVSVPLKFQNKNMVFVPLMHSANQLVRWMSAYEGIMPFRPNDSEQPEINYKHMPIRGLYELRRMMDALQSHLKDVRCPVLLLQGNGDPVVSPNSAELLYDGLEQANRTLKVIEAKRHGILSENIGGTQQIIVDFIAGGTTREKTLLPAPLQGLQPV
ncbi:MAG: alpha/beta fold hydrolase [Arenicellales bacterium]|nr:alpha/beta fold hydrolase [Arenicellales bacterium]